MTTWTWQKIKGQTMSGQTRSINTEVIVKVQIGGDEHQNSDYQMTETNE